MNSPLSNPVYFLLVDDLADNLMALDALLRREGLVMLKAHSGPEALELLLKYDVALALIDVQMPEMDGFELAEMMRGTERTRRVPIIFVTAATVNWQRRFQGYEAGAVDFLHKPVEPDILRSKALVFYELYRQRQEVAAQRDELKAATEENIRLLAESHRQAEALVEADTRKDEFLAMLAHELRNPLAPVQNAVEILSLYDSTDDVIISVREVISRQVAHMARLIDDLLDVARIVRGKINLQIEQLDLPELIRLTVEDYRSTFSRNGITLELELPEQPVFVRGDRTRLAQVLGNLLHNAGKFTPVDGQVQVVTKLDPEAKRLFIEVRDTGSGMTPQILERLFEPFIQADQSIARTKGGLGLGLALAKGLLEMHGGGIVATSPGLDRGATFTVDLPILENANETQTETADKTLEAAPKFKILLVEDNRDAANSMRMLLALRGHQVGLADDAGAGVKLALEMIPDVIISDLGLPGELDGYGFAKKIRSEPSLQAVFLIALSGYGHDEHRKKSKEAGFDKHLVKPIDLAELELAFERIKPMNLK